MTDNIELSIHVEKYRNAKEKAAKANAEADEALKMIDKLMPQTKIEGATSEVVGINKVTLTRKINRTVNEEKVNELAPTLRSRFFKTKHSLIMDKYRNAEKSDLLVLSKCLTSKPGKPSLKIEDLEDAD